MSVCNMCDSHTACKVLQHVYNMNKHQKYFSNFLSLPGWVDVFFTVESK